MSFVNTILGRTALAAALLAGAAAPAWAQKNKHGEAEVSAVQTARTKPQSPGKAKATVEALKNEMGTAYKGALYGQFMITSDGYYGLGIFRNGKAVLLGQDQMQLNSAIHTGAAINHLRIDCNGDDLAPFVNGFKLPEAHDSALKDGDVGLLAGTFQEPGADIVFDNFVVFVP